MDQSVFIYYHFLLLYATSDSRFPLEKQQAIIVILLDQRGISEMSSAFEPDLSLVKAPVLRPIRTIHGAEVGELEVAGLVVAANHL